MFRDSRVFLSCFRSYWPRLHRGHQFRFLVTLAFVVAPVFLLSAYAYLRWRSDSWLVALGYTILLHFFSCLPAGINVFAHVTRNA